MDFRMNQPALAPMGVGGSIVTGIVGVLIALYNIEDCLRFRTGPGQCKSVIEQNVPLLIVGAAAVAGPVSGYFTYNPKLRRRDEGYTESNTDTRP
jgi:hypothetical protein